MAWGYEERGQCLLVNRLPLVDLCGWISRLAGGLRVGRSTPGEGAGVSLAPCPSCICPPRPAAVICILRILVSI
jgi:hypothetical protein